MKGAFTMAMHLTDEGLINKKEWEEHGVRLPEYDGETGVYLMDLES